MYSNGAAVNEDELEEELEAIEMQANRVRLLCMRHRRSQPTHVA
jgi:hypothetical protein